MRLAPTVSEEGVIEAPDTSKFENVKVNTEFGKNGALKDKGIWRVLVAPTRLDERLGVKEGIAIGVVTLTERAFDCMYLIPLES